MKLAQFAVLIMVCNTVNASNEEIRWIYSNPYTMSRSVLVITRNPNIIIANLHKSEKWSVCKEKNYICINSSYLKFSVPLKVKSDSVWSVDNVSYSVVKEGEVSILGNVIKDVYVVKGEYYNDVSFYLFSKQFGLLSIIIPKDQEYGMLVLENRCGFGASDECRNY